MKLGRMIALARELKGLPLRELEKLTGISNALLSQIETGKVRDPGFRKMVKISRALGVDLKHLADAD